jgi:nucleoside-diphosphate-sugar epimerase
MRIFITGVCGYLGQAVAQAFRDKGHTVYGLVRSEEKATQLSLAEIRPIMGDMNNPDSYRKTLEEVDVAVHCALDSSEKMEELDAKTIDTILDVFSKSATEKTFIYTSGIWVYGSTGGNVADETFPLNPIELAKWRPAHENKVINANSDHLHTIILRPASIYGGKRGFLGLMNIFFESLHDGAVTIIGDGANYRPLIHIVDLAHAYVSAVEKKIKGVILNVVDDSCVTVKDIALAIAKSAGVPDQLHSVSVEEYKKQLGPIVDGLALDQKVSNAKIKELLQWKIHHFPFIEEVDLYFNAWKASQKVVEF